MRLAKWESSGVYTGTGVDQEDNHIAFVQGTIGLGPHPALKGAGSRFLQTCRVNDVEPQVSQRGLRAGGDPASRQANRRPAPAFCRPGD